ncbi:hypothetical protein DPMN_133688 [Dreissena polymorpha]|uniref:Uncharacterized protein n=1 Tax=Dreissena polymorpha TaxID=45954 RepID=A0A9D4JB86_DREPO|nr:hypothetical protein DPMN_133688 [Dreissena polymorpha]
MTLLREKNINELFKLKDYNRVSGRVRPLIKEDISVSHAKDIVSLDQNDGGVLHHLKLCEKGAYQIIRRIFSGRSTETIVM